MNDEKITPKQRIQELETLRQRCADLAKMESAYKELEQAFRELERKQAEENKEETEKKYRELYEGSQDGFVKVDMQGHIQEFNQAYREMVGYRAEELRKRTYVDLTPAKWHAMEAQILRDQVLTRGYSSVYEKELIRKDGSVFPISLRQYLIKDANGDPVSMWAFVRDITGRKEMEKALRQSRDELEAQVRRRTGELARANELLETVFSSINILIAYMSRDFTYIRVNRAYAERDGNPPEYYAGKNHFDLFPDEENKAIFRRVVETGEPYFAYGTPLVDERHPERGMTYWDWSVQPVKEPEGRVTGLVLSLIDVTPRKRAEQQLQESEKQLRYLSSQLLAAQEHERRRVALDLHDGLGQALTAIKYKVENFIQEGSRSRMKTKLQPLKDLIPIIQECVREIHRVQINLRPSILDDLGILATISWLCREFQSMYANIEIEKRIDILEDEVPDPLKMIIYRILQEALNNVAKHSGANSLSLSLQRLDGKLELAVQDNGRGFDLQEALSQMASGRGLGLVSMRERAEQSGGYFSIESGTGKGTTIRVAWPVQP